MTSPPTAAPAPTAASPPSSVGPPPTIVPNRQRLDNRFPVLAFTVRTFGRPLFEILLATERALFDPANAARRTPGNFYAGRQDGGLARATADDTAFVVPTAALRRFADAKPRAGEIYFTVAAYATAEGPPEFAQPVATLAISAPCVVLGRDFAAHTLAYVLGVPSHKLCLETVSPDRPHYAPAMEVDDDGIAVGEATSWTSHAVEAHELAEAAAPEDGEPEALALDDDDDDLGPTPATYAAAHALDEDDDAYGRAPASAAYDEHAYGAEVEQDADHDLGYAAEEEWGEPHAASGANAVVDDDDYARGYEDGYGDTDPPDAWARGSRSHAYDADADAAAHVHEHRPDDQAPAQAYDYEGFGHPEDDEGLGPDEHEAPRWPAAREGAFATDEYDDGYDTAAAWDDVAASAYSGGASEPAMLADVDEDRLDQELVGATADHGHSESYGATSPEHDSAHANGNGSGNGAAARGPPPFGIGSSSSRELDLRTQIGIVTKIGRLFESPEGFRGIGADTEFSTPNLPQHGRWHVGLTYGLIGFTQDSGLLGRLLSMMQSRDPEAFASIFGPDAPELLRVTNLKGPSSRELPAGRSTRVQPVAGADLWIEPWLSRFRRAAEHRPFQAAQNQLAVESFLYPMLFFAHGFGLNTERALAMVCDRAIHMGVAGARAWLVGAIGPIRTDAQRQQALGALGIGSLRELQQANRLPVDGTFGALTHAALVGALRALGPASSPIPIPKPEQLMDAIVARADGEQAWWRRRPHVLRESSELADAPLTWPTPPPVVR